VSSKRSLCGRLGSAQYLLRQYRAALVDGYKVRGGPDRGKVVDAAALHEMERFDRAIAAVGDAIKRAKESS
jgi:hypothetical protein